MYKRQLAGFFVLTEEGLGVTQHFTRTLDTVVATAESYMWHIVIAYSIIIAFIIFMEGQNPDRTILWMLVLVFVPVFGVILYLILGPDLQSIRNRRLFRPAKKYGFDHSPFKKATEDQFLIGSMLHACSGADLLVRNRVEILINGAETFPAIEAAIAGAEKFIHMEFFIIRDDDLGRRIGGMLMEEMCIRDRLTTGRASDRFGPSRFMALGLLFAAIGTAAAPFLFSIRLLAALTLASAGLGVFYLASMIFLNETVDERLKGTISGAYYLFFGVGLCFGPPLFSLVMGMVGCANSLICLAACLLYTFRCV